MKKLFSVLLTLALVFTLLPAKTASADDGWLEIGSTRYDAPASGDGWTYSKEGSMGTLTLTDANIPDIYAISMDLTIILNGSNTVTGGYYGINLDNNGNLTIQGNGSLTVFGEYYGINCSDLTITGCTVEVEGSADISSAVFIDGRFTISGNTILDAQCPNRALVAQKGITIGDGLGITSPAGGSMTDSKTTTLNPDGSFATVTRIEPAFTITFDANGGGGTMNSQAVPKNRDAALLTNSFTWDGRSFKGWTLSSDGTGTVYGDGATVNLSGDITLYAQWYKILTITANNSEFIYDGQIHGPGDTEYDDPAQIAEIITADGLFEGDEITSIVLDGQGTDVGDYTLTPSGATVSNAAGDNNTEKYDIRYVEGTLTINPDKYTITFVNEDGTVLQSGDVAVGGMPSYSGNTPTKESDKDHIYTFDKWDPEISEVTADATYTATFTSKRKPDNSQPAPDTTPTTPTPSRRSSGTKARTKPAEVKYSLADDTELTWKKGSEEGLKIELKRENAESTVPPSLYRIDMDGTEVPSDNIKVSEDGLVIELDPEYLEGLDESEHDIKMVFRDGSLETKLGIEEADPERTEPEDSSSESEPAEEPAEIPEQPRKSHTGLFIGAGAALLLLIRALLKKRGNKK